MTTINQLCHFLSSVAITTMCLGGCSDSEGIMPGAQDTSERLPEPKDILRAIVSLSADRSTEWYSLSPEMTDRTLLLLRRKDREYEASLSAIGTPPQADPPEYEIYLICRDFSSIQILCDASLTEFHLSSSLRWLSGTIFTIEDSSLAADFRQLLDSEKSPETTAK